MEALGYYNGEVGPLEEMRVPMLDRACYFGDGCYDGMMAHKGRLIFCDLHVDRFYRSASMLGMEVPMPKGELVCLLADLASQVDADDVFVYWQLSRGTARRTQRFPGGDVKPNLWVMITPSPAPNPAFRHRLASVEDKRFLFCNIKTINLIPTVLANQEAHEQGCTEAVFVRDGIVTECTHSNISMLAGGVLVTHPLDEHILPGTMRQVILDLARGLGIPVEERRFTLEELRAADEVIVSSSTNIFAPAVELDGEPVGGKAPELLGRLQDAMMDAWRAEAGETVEA